MSRISAMTIGLVLIFIGAELTLVKSVVLSPTAHQFLQEDLQPNNEPIFTTGKKKSSSWFSGFSQGNQSYSNAGAGQSWPYYKTGNGDSNTSSIQSSSFKSPLAKIENIGAGKRLAPPRWMKWPPLFIGIVFFLHGVALRP